ncbi:MAG: methyltransferase domain-containing protein [Bdellovibrionota bacterium]
MALENPYAARLQNFASFAFNNEDGFQFRGGWEEFFLTRMGARPSRVVLEIGCSIGTLLCQAAKENPDVGFVGVDWKFKSIYKAARRADSEKLKNIALLRNRAELIEQAFGLAEVDEVWIFFPDPWAKKSQLKHRLIRPEFLESLFKIMKPGAKVFFKTDHPGYFQWIFALFGVQQPNLPAYDHENPQEKSKRARQMKVRRLESEQLPEASVAAQQSFELKRYSIDFWKESRPIEAMFVEAQSNFERLFIKENLPIYYVELVKRDLNS